MTMLANDREIRREVAQLLELVCIAVQLTKTQHESAEGRYHFVGEWLGAEDSPLAKYSPLVYPQGSMALETTVRPRGRVEFDLDLVCVLNHPSGPYADPEELSQLVRSRIAAHGTLAPLLEPHGKCIRLAYANDFHLDIIPALPHFALSATGIYVPLKCDGAWEWKPNDPKRFARWFHEEAIVEAYKFAARAHVEPLPDRREALDKEPLRRTVQLLKRHRDVRYNGHAEAPSSIILTTLAGQHYGGERNSYDALLAVLAGVAAAMERTDGILAVYNPVNPEENFTSGWTERQYTRFREFIAEFIVSLHQLGACEGIDDIAEKLSKLFDVKGQDAVSQAVREYERRFTGARQSGSLGMTANSVITTAPAAAIAVPRGTFYGDQGH